MHLVKLVPLENASAENNVVASDTGHSDSFKDRSRSSGTERYSGRNTS